MTKQHKLYDLNALSHNHEADTEFIEHMVSLFLATIPETKNLLIEAADTEDWSQVYFFSHKLKASIDIFNLDALKLIIRNIESRSKKVTVSNKEQLKQDVHFVAEYLEKCLIQMKVEFGEPHTKP